MRTVYHMTNQFLEKQTYGEKTIHNSVFKLVPCCCMYLTQSNKYQTISTNCYFCPFRSAQDLIEIKSE